MMRRVRTASRSRSRTRSYKNSSRRLLEFSLNATWAPNGKLGNHSVELNWAEQPQRSKSSKKSRSSHQKSSRSTTSHCSRSSLPSITSESQEYSNLVEITNATRTMSPADFGPPIPINSFRGSIERSTSQPTSDVYLNSPQSTKTRTCTKSCCSTTVSPISVSQMVRLVSVDLRVAFFEWPGLIVRKQVVREIRNDLTVLEVLQHLIRCAGIRLDPAMNVETARLFLLKEVRPGRQRLDEVDYLQWRCALLGEMTNADQIQFTLDFTETEDAEAAPSTSTNTPSSVRGIDFDFKPLSSSSENRP